LAGFVVWPMICLVIFPVTVPRCQTALAGSPVDVVAVASCRGLFSFFFHSLSACATEPPSPVPKAVARDEACGWRPEWLRAFVLDKNFVVGQELGR